MNARKPLTVLLAVLAITAAACGDDATSDPTTSTATSTVPGDTADASTTTAAAGVGAAAIVGTRWIVDGFTVDGLEYSLVPDASPTVEFSADGPEIRGTTGCNSYFATVQYGADGELSVLDGVGQTEMACGQDGLMDQEAWFTKAIQEIRLYEVEGDRLTLASDTGDVIISAVNRDSVETPVGLGDVMWVADTRIEGDAASTLVPGTVVTLRFDFASGSIGGNTGCNSFGGAFSVDEDRIVITDLMGTQKACEGAVMDQERFIYEMLGAADQFTIDGGRLTILANDGRGLGLTPDPAG